MPKYRIYLDSDVFISCIRQEINGAFNLRFQDAETFLALCARHKIEIMLSDAFFGEVEQITGLDKKDIIKSVQNYKVLIKTVQGTENTEKTARAVVKNCGLHFSDAKHVSLALEAGCDVLVTWNKRDFEKAHSYITCANPIDFVSAYGNTLR